MKLHISTPACAADGVPARITIDLQSVHEVVEVRWQNTNGHRYDRGARLVRLSVSPDGESYTTAGEIELPDAAHRKVIDI